LEGNVGLIEFAHIHADRARNLRRLLNEHHHGLRELHHLGVSRGTRAFKILAEDCLARFGRGLQFQLRKAEVGNRMLLLDVRL
jgi:hypothetical protein